MITMVMMTSGETIGTIMERKILQMTTQMVKMKKNLLRMIMVLRIGTREITATMGRKLTMKTQIPTQRLQMTKEQVRRLQISRRLTLKMKLIKWEQVQIKIR